MKVRIDYDGKTYFGSAYPTHRGGNPVCVVAADGIHGPEMGCDLDVFDKLEHGETARLVCGMVVTPCA